MVKKQKKFSFIFHFEKDVKSGLTYNRNLYKGGILMEDKNKTQSWYSLAFIWGGSMVCVPSLLIGSTLVSGMSLGKSLLVGLIGYAITVVIMILQGTQSVDLHKPTVQIAKQVFGEIGSQRIISIILAIACLGWFGIQTNVAGSAFANLLGLYGIRISVPVSSIVWGMIMLVTAIYGIRLIRLINYIAVPYLVIVCLYGLFEALSGQSNHLLQTYQPTAQLSFFDGLAVTIGSFALGAVIAGDYSQYSEKRSDVVKAASVGIIPAGILMIAVGAILAIVNRTSDISSVFMNIGSPLIGGIALILATWKTNVINAFSGGLAIINVFGISKEKEKIAVAIAGGVGTLLAVAGILNYFVPIMSILSAMVPAVAGVMIASYWVVQKGDPAKWSPVSGINWVGIISWLIGAVIAVIPVLLGFFPSVIQLPNQPLIGIILSFFCYLIGNKLFEKQLTKHTVSTKEMEE
ncbi:cytosine/purines uracil thiamine allantoin permease [Enterococcus raffinosus ATCC 49464]|uniref:Cytosine/purines uracil thiamine allantoin permease n=3 Tax=Enterococcus raffinosus TaxID=71452 RepID=A0ABN0M6Y8_9ENTE|nr:cytosine/purines uracil thiamine allantoin permease [Enterococcus raffinosus ATCC 49464]